MRTARRNSAWRLWWPFALLCLLGGSRWILSESLPGSSTTLGSAALGCGSAAALYLLVFRPSVRERWNQLLRSAFGGALLITGPLIALLTPHTVSAANLTMALALTPVVIAVAEAAANHSSETLAGRLWPGLAAIAGLLLLLPQPSLASPGEDLVLALTPLITGCGAVLFCGARPSSWRIPAALLGACAALAVGAIVNTALHVGTWPGMPGVAAGFDAVQALLAFVALGRLSATRWSAQFAIVPLLVLLQGIAFTPSSVPARMIVGLLLLAVAAFALLMPPAEEQRFDLAGPAMHPSRPD